MYVRRFIAPTILASCIVAGPMVGLVSAQVDRGTPPAATTNYDARDTGRDRDWGWIGLLGLAGLAGLTRNRRTTDNVGTRPATATR